MHKEADERHFISVTSSTRHEKHQRREGNSQKTFGHYEATLLVSRGTPLHIQNIRCPDNESKTFNRRSLLIGYRMLPVFNILL